MSVQIPRCPLFFLVSGGNRALPGWKAGSIGRNPPERSTTPLPRMETLALKGKRSPGFNGSGSGCPGAGLGVGLWNRGWRLVPRGVGRFPLLFFLVSWGITRQVGRPRLWQGLAWPARRFVGHPGGRPLASGLLARRRLPAPPGARISHESRALQAQGGSASEAQGGRQASAMPGTHCWGIQATTSKGSAVLRRSTRTAGSRR